MALGHREPLLVYGVHPTGRLDLQGRRLGPGQWWGHFLSKFLQCKEVSATDLPSDLWGVEEFNIGNISASCSLPGSGPKPLCDVLYIKDIVVRDLRVGEPYQLCAQNAHYPPVL